MFNLRHVFCKLLKKIAFSWPLSTFVLVVKLFQAVGEDFGGHSSCHRVWSEAKQLTRWVPFFIASNPRRVTTMLPQCHRLEVEEHLVLVSLTLCQCKNLRTNLILYVLACRDIIFLVGWHSMCGYYVGTIVTWSSGIALVDLMDGDWWGHDTYRYARQS